MQIHLYRKNLGVKLYLYDFRWLLICFLFPSCWGFFDCCCFCHSGDCYCCSRFLGVCFLCVFFCFEIRPLCLSHTTSFPLIFWIIKHINRLLNSNCAFLGSLNPDTSIQPALLKDYRGIVVCFGNKMLKISQP